jgi:type II secretory pathway pseudopilin PulG
MKKQSKLLPGEKGQTLLELLLAFGVSILVLGAVILSVITALNNTQYAKNQGLANSYAREAMSLVRAKKDSDWSQFVSGYTTGITYCLGQSPSELKELTFPAQNCNQQSPVPTGGIFSREVKFNHKSSSCCPDNSQTCDPDTRGSQVMVKVSWADSKCPIGNPLCHNIELVTCFLSVDQKSLESLALPTFAVGPTSPPLTFPPTPTSPPLTFPPTPTPLPSGWTLCAQFVNTNGDDVASNFMDGCLNTTGLRIQVYYGAVLEEDIYSAGMTPISAWPSFDYLNGTMTFLKLINWGPTQFFVTTSGKDACGSQSAPDGVTMGSGMAGKAIIAPGNTDSYEYRLNCGGGGLTGRQISIYKQ